MAYGRNKPVRGGQPGIRPSARRGAGRCRAIADPIARQRCEDMEATNTGVASTAPAGTGGALGGRNPGRGMAGPGRGMAGIRGYKRKY